MVWQLQSEATSIETWPSYELSKLPVHLTMPAGMRDVNFHGKRKHFAECDCKHIKYARYGSSDRGADASNRSKMRNETTELRTSKVAGLYTAGLPNAKSRHVRHGSTIRCYRPSGFWLVIQRKTCFCIESFKPDLVPFRNDRDNKVQSWNLSHCVRGSYAPEECRSPNFSLVPVLCFLHVSRQNTSFCTVLSTSSFPSFIGLPWDLVVLSEIGADRRMLHFREFFGASVINAWPKQV